VVADLDEHNNVIASYTWGDGIDNLLAVKVGGASYYPLTDIQGTVWGYIDSQNNVVACWQYDAWGNVVEEDVAIPVLASLRYRFQGREWSAATGLVNFRMRWYDPETGRWLSKDPIGLSGGLNLYSFCGENPLTFIDPLGRSFWPEAIDRWGRFNRCVNPGLIGSWIWHHYVREYFNAPLPETPPSVEGTGWRKLSRKESVFHDNGDEYEECKYVHKDGREVVYDGRTNEIITDTVYKGTYNFVNPGTADDGWIEYSARFVGHGVLDVIPYLIMGN
jgi:RHS repeat-associated protein